MVAGWLVGWLLAAGYGSLVSIYIYIFPINPIFPFLCGFKARIKFGNCICCCGALHGSSRDGLNDVMHVVGDGIYLSMCPGGPI